MTEEKHRGASAAVDKAQDAVGAAVGKTAAAVGGGSTSAFVKNAALSDIYEIKAAEVALQRSRSDKIRQIAEEMRDDHIASSRNLRVALQGRRLENIETPPTELDDRRRGLVDNLKKAPEDEFDKRYLDQQAAAHDEALTLFRNYRDNGDDQQLKSFAVNTLPVLERHYEHVKSAQSGQ